MANSNLALGLGAGANLYASYLAGRQQREDTVLKQQLDKQNADLEFEFKQEQIKKWKARTQLEKDTLEIQQSQEERLNFPNTPAGKAQIKAKAATEAAEKTAAIQLKRRLDGPQGHLFQNLLSTQPAGTTNVQALNFLRQSGIMIEDPETTKRNAAIETELRKQARGIRSRIESGETSFENADLELADINNRLGSMGVATEDIDFTGTTFSPDFQLEIDAFDKQLDDTVTKDALDQEKLTVSQRNAASTEAQVGLSRQRLTLAEKTENRIASKISSTDAATEEELEQRIAKRQLIRASKIQIKKGKEVPNKAEKLAIKVLDRLIVEDKAKLRELRGESPARFDPFGGARSLFQGANQLISGAAGALSGLPGIQGPPVNSIDEGTSSAIVGFASLMKQEGKSSRWIIDDILKDSPALDKSLVKDLVESAQK